MPVKISLLALLIMPFTLKAHQHLQMAHPIAVATNNHLTNVIISKYYGEMQFGIVTISWKTYNTDTNNHFFIERSENGKDFTTIGKVAGNQSLDSINFFYRDTNPLPTGFYRIKTVNIDTLYSEIIRLSTISGMPLIKVTPLVFDALITVELTSKINEEFTIALSNREGKVLSSRLVNTEKGKNTIVFDDAISFLYADEYLMSVTGIKFAFSQKLYKK